MEDFEDCLNRAMDSEEIEAARVELYSYLWFNLEKDRLFGKVTPNNDLKYVHEFLKGPMSAYSDLKSEGFDVSGLERRMRAYISVIREYVLEH